jgi:hypothetical protein
MHVRIQLLALEHCWSISSESCWPTLLIGLFSLQATTTCLPTWRTGWNHSASTIMRWWKVSKCGRAHSRQTSLTQAYINLFPDATSSSILVVTTLRNSLSMYVFFIYNNFFLVACFINITPEVTSRIALVFNHLIFQLFYCLLKYSFLFTINWIS